MSLIKSGGVGTNNVTIAFVHLSTVINADTSNRYIVPAYPSTSQFYVHDSATITEVDVASNMDLIDLDPNQWGIAFSNTLPVGKWAVINDEGLKMLPFVPGTANSIDEEHYKNKSFCVLVCLYETTRLG